MTTTTQDNFTAMRGHVDDGTVIRMNNGQVLTIRPDMRGWRIVDEAGRQISDSDMSAFGVECFIITRT